MADKWHFEFDRVEIFQDASSPEIYILFYSNHGNGVSISSGFHDIPQNISVGFTDVIN